MESLESLPALAPLEFFQVALDARYTSSGALSRKHQLTSTAELLDEGEFASVLLGWNEEGVFIDVEVQVPFQEASYPDFETGDAVELFFDTRDLKTAGFATRFCHHFLFLPSECQGIQCQEITRFRTEDTHPLCDPKELQIESVFEKKGYVLHIGIPKSCLCGWDPSEFERLGFTYRIHRKGGDPQHFALSSEHFKIEQHPRLWATLSLRK